MVGIRGIEGTEGFKKALLEKYGEGYDVGGVYKGRDIQIRLTHECGKEWEIKPTTMYYSKNSILCPECNSLNNKLKRYIGNFYKKYDSNEFELVEETFKGLEYPVEVIHRRCGRKITRVGSVHLLDKNGNNNMCMKCVKNEEILTYIEQFLNYQEFEYDSGTISKIKLKHLECKRTFGMNRVGVKGEDCKINCPECGEDEKKKGIEIEREKINLRIRKIKEYQNLEGKKFGLLTALEDVGVHRTTESRMWKCRCDCGEIIETQSTSLRSGHTKSCGCRGRELIEFKRKGKVYKRTDLTGNRYGKLVVKGVVEHKRDPKKTLWIAECDCGGNRVTTYGVFEQNNAKSCGCTRVVDETGNKYGMLTPIKYEEDFSKQKGYTYWRCKCDCGGETIKNIASLRTGGTVSCGCLTMSIGEFMIKEELEKHGVKYKSEYSFRDLRHVNPLRFDVALVGKNGRVKHLIEFDGEQHYKEVDFFNSDLELIQYRDKLKDDYCRDNNIPLTRIPYTERENIPKIIEKLLNNDNGYNN